MKHTTTSRKATHQGTCQICGASQKLPAGVLSLHGYTTRWGFFSGICGGSGFLPFEQSKDLIEGAISRTETDIQVTEAVSNGLKAGELREDGKAWHHVYKRKLYTYAWELVTITAVQKTSGDYTWTDFAWVSDSGEEKNVIESYTLRGYGLDPRTATVDDARKGLNRDYAESFLDTRCADMRRYIQWQRERIANWKPQELKPIAK